MYLISRFNVELLLNSCIQANMPLLPESFRHLECNTLKGFTRTLHFCQLGCSKQQSCHKFCRVSSHRVLCTAALASKVLTLRRETGFLPQFCWTGIEASLLLWPDFFRPQEELHATDAGDLMQEIRRCANFLQQVESVCLASGSSRKAASAIHGIPPAGNPQHMWHQCRVLNFDLLKSDFWSGEIWFPVFPTNSRDAYLGKTSPNWHTWSLTSRELMKREMEKAIGFNQYFRIWKRKTFWWRGD